MDSKALTHRFKIGRTYRLRNAPEYPKYIGGTMTVRAELKPIDQWGNRIILCDCQFNPPVERDGAVITAMNGIRVFVEEGVTEFTDSFGVRRVPVEIAALQGVYPRFGKTYAIDECSATAAA